jgi:hypothetical protein
MTLLIERRRGAQLPPCVIAGSCTEFVCEKRAIGRDSGFGVRGLSPANVIKVFMPERVRSPRLRQLLVHVVEFIERRLQADQSAP